MVGGVEKERKKIKTIDSETADKYVNISKVNYP